ncbi:hypothetical protein MJO52_11910 [Microbulbifer variabilis]|uniref:Uncharacterized protein n=1 Tax=Microbulbifer variabilis TaxID=266805 RepID=A0ABY4V6D5_9GAMM|nr:hypothetical protein [Microbulbifer variabilis]USD19788.1 hypothetical protein MJO52_11910 [Microbulbifer variabilis]
MNRALTDKEKDRIWKLFYSLTTGNRALVDSRKLGMVAADLTALCCHLVQQDPQQGTAAKKLLRTLLNAYEQEGIKTACNQVISHIDTNASEIAALASPHIEITRAFPVVGDEDE